MAKYFYSLYLYRRAWFLCIWLLLLSASASRAQGPTWQTVVGIPQNPAAFSHVLQTVPDGHGNVYVGGYFSGTLTLGATSLTSRFSQLFLAKWSRATGQYVWGVTYGDGLTPTGLAVQGTSIYLSASTSFPAGYVLKFTDAGTSVNLGWAQSFPNAQMGGLALSGTDIYLTGSFSNRTITFGNTTLANTGYSSLFLTKFTDTGTSPSYLWATRATGTSPSSAVIPQRVVVQNSTVYLSGYFINEATFGSTHLASSGQGDIFISKLTDVGTEGRFIWTTSFGGNSNDYAPQLIVNGASLYVGGSFFSASMTCGNTTLPNAGSTDIYVTKLVDTGTGCTFSWAKRAGGTSGDILNGMALQGSTLYITGYFGSLAAASISFDNITLSNAGPISGYLAALTDGGLTNSFAWAQVVGGAGGDYMTSLAVDGPLVYLGGYVGSASFRLGSFTLSNYQDREVGLLASFIYSAALATATPLPLVGSQLYPNPATGTTTWQLAAGTQAKGAVLTLLDELGRVVRSTYVALPTTGLRYELNLLGLARGTYHLRVQAEEHVGWHRLQVD